MLDHPLSRMMTSVNRVAQRETKKAGIAPGLSLTCVPRMLRSAKRCAADPGPIYLTTCGSRLCEAAQARRIASGTLSVRSALRRRGRPRLDQRVVVDGFALRLLIRQLALGRDVAVLCGLVEPEFGGLLLVQLRPALFLHAGLLKTFHHRVLGRGQRVHCRLRG